MEFNIRLPGTDPAERRRLQNRLAQRKFRLRKAANNDNNKSGHASASSRPTSGTLPAQSTTHDALPPPSDDLTNPNLAVSTLLPGISLADTSGIAPHASGASHDMLDESFLVDMDAGSDRLWSDPTIPALSSRTAAPICQVPVQYPDFRFGLSAGSFETAPSGTSATPQHLLPLKPQPGSGNHVSIPDGIAEGTLQAGSTSPYNNPTTFPEASSSSSTAAGGQATSSSNATSVRLPPPRPPQQPLYECQISPSGDADEAFQILTTAPPGSTADGWLGPLHIAAQKGHRSIVLWLLAHGHADPDERDSDGRTPLMHAAAAGHDAVVQALLAHGARVAEADRDGRTAIHLAVLYRRADVLRRLLEQGRRDGGAGVGIDAWDVSGWSAVHMAAERDFEEGLTLLLEHGARVDNRARRCPLMGKVR